MSRQVNPRLWRGLVFMGLLLPALTQAAPYRPADKSQVLERLPAALRASALRSQRAQAAQADPGSAAALARAYLQRARAESDPRLTGYAEGLLQPWWSLPEPPPQILLLRATIRQSRHEFATALADLDLLLKRYPRDAQAWLTRAVVLRVSGRLDEAAQSCTHLPGLTTPLVVDLCRLPVQSLRGALEPSYREALTLRAAAADQPAEIGAWLYAELTDMAERLGDPAAALEHARAGLALAPQDHGLIASVADLLLAAARPAEALALVEPHPQVDALQLRRVLALQRLQRTEYASAERLLRDGYRAAHARGEDLHLREEARYALELQGDAVRALELAQANWQVQRELADARLLLAAARAAGQPQAAQSVYAWLEQYGVQDARLAAVRSP